jgi:regulator of sigma E protease
MPDVLVNIWNVVLVVIAFGAVIFIHEMGHFLAAKWAGIKVHAFAVGFGQAIGSWRKGMGLRRGSSEAEYDKLVAAHESGVGDRDISKISETEYRLNWFPFGGYVRMLGQEDGNPEATSDDPDSYTAKPVYKRMVVISAGVVMNVLLAAVLFVGVFLAGLRTEAPVVGMVTPNGGGSKAGILAGDVILSIDGRETETFQDVFVAVAMSAPGKELDIRVAREGEAEAVLLTAVPERDETTGFRQLGISPGVGVHLLDTKRAKQAEIDAFRERLDKIGLGGVPLDARLVEVNGTALAPIESSAGPVESGSALGAAGKRSEGGQVRAVFEGNTDGEEHTVELLPEPAYPFAVRTTGEGKKEQTEVFSHLLGLSPVMGVYTTTERGFEQGLRDGDVFARIGGTAWPSVLEGVREIKSHTGDSIEIEVVRDGAFETMVVEVSREGLIGFNIDPGFSGARVTDLPWVLGESGESLGLARGSEIVSVDGAAVGSFDGLFRAVRSKSGTVVLGVREAGTEVVREVEWEIGESEQETLAGIGWQLDRVVGNFSLAQVNLKAGGPIDALAMGVRHTHLKIEATYLTFLRMIDGSVPVNQVSGPVGIVHIGSRVAERGMLHLLFLMAIVSANLAVINFLPFPVVDGGHFVMLLYEGIRRKPVPIRFQNAVTMAGLVVIVGIFLFVTFNDLSRWFSGS